MQFLNAPPPILVTDDGIVITVIPVFENIFDPMLVVLSRLRLLSAVFPAKILLPSVAFE